jgi:microcystin-dependent protein
MADPFLGEIRMFGSNFAPSGWALCNGQLLAISQNDALFAILGTTYGGDGQTTFALPDLRGRLPIGPGQGPALQNYILGEIGGAETVTLLTTQLPPHDHIVTKGTIKIAASSATANRRNPSQAVPAVEAAGVTAIYSDAPPNTTLAPAALKGAPQTITTGGGQPTSVMQPSLAVTFIIALEGIFPSRN